MNLYRLLLCLFCYIYTAHSIAQDYLCYSEKISVEDGLSNRFVQAITQDNQGFMWFGTKHGLNRYDGNHFISFTSENSLLHGNNIGSLHTDVEGMMWIAYANSARGTFKELDILDPITLTIQSVQDFLPALPFEVAPVHKIQTDAKKRLYFATINGEIYRYSGNKKLELVYKHTTAGIVHELLVGEYYIWVHVHDRLIAFDASWNLIKQVSIEKYQNKDGRFTDMIGEPTSSSIWLELNNEYDTDQFLVWDLDLDTLTEKNSFDWFPNLPNGKSCHAIYQNDKTNFIYKSRKALVLLDSNKQSFYTLLAKDNAPIQTIYEDKQHNIWLSTISEGLLKVSYKKNKFQSFLQGSSMRGLITLNNDSLLLANRYGQQVLYNLYTKETDAIDTDQTIAFDKSNDGKYLWITSEKIATFRSLTTNPKEIKSYYPPISKNKDTYQSPLGWSILQDKKGTVWVGTAEGLSYIPPAGEAVSIYEHYNQLGTLKHSVVNFLYENEEGLWVASSSGLYLIDNIHDKGVLTHYDLETLPHTHIMHIHQEGAIFWLSTKGGGLLKWNRTKQTCQQYTTKQGLAHNVVYAVLPDEFGYLWMSTDYGLVQFEPRTETFTTYLPSDGIPHEEFNHTSFYKDETGHLYFGGLNGVVRFEPKDFLVPQKDSTPIRIIDYQYFDGTTNELVQATAQLQASPQIVLQHTDRFFILKVALLDFVNSKKVSYAYKIDGLDADWNNLANNTIRINGLKAGTYTLLVKAKTSNGVWSNQIIRLPIKVNQPFYLSLWFLFFVFFAAILMLLGYARWRVQRLQYRQTELKKEVKKRTKKIAQQAKELQLLDEAKSNFFANITHELRTPLTLMIAPVSAILEEHYGKDWNKISEVLQVVQNNGNKLQHLIEEILLLSKLDNHKLQTKAMAVSFLPYLQQHILLFRAQANLQDINLEFDYQLDNATQLLLDTHKFEIIFNNLVINALKYTPAGGTVRIAAQAIEHEGRSCFQLLIKDSGSGIAPVDLPHIFDRFYQANTLSNEGTGIGLSLVSELTQFLGGTIRAESSLESGSSFFVVLPLTIPTTPSETVAAATKEQKAILTQQSATILLVEDNADMSNFLQDLLQPYYQVVAVADGQFALDWLAESAELPQLILSDVMMPRVNGMQLLQALKVAETWQQIPVILLTAQANRQDKIKALRIGVDDYLQKPFSSPELFARIQNLLQNALQRKNSQQEATNQLLDSAAAEIQPAATPPILEIAPNSWLAEVEAIATKQVGNTQFGILQLAADLHLSERQLRRKIKLKTGLTPNQYFTHIKLEVARQYLEAGRYETVAEVSHKIGFSNTHYFSKIYQKHFGKKPSDYLKS